MELPPQSRPIDHWALTSQARRHKLFGTTLFFREGSDRKETLPMPTKRQVIEHFTRDELLQGVDEHAIEVGDRRVKDKLIEALASSRKVALEALLTKLPRERLKALCAALDLDDSGREKAVLVGRLTGATSARSAKTEADPTPALVESGRLTTDALERYLWSAADILRGSIDSSDYKGFIFGLLFLKRLSDRFEEECEAVAREGGDPEDQDEHEFFVPKRARWGEIQKVASNIGEALNKACSSLEDHDRNSRMLEGVLAGIDFNDERKLGDAKQRDAVLARLVQHFSALNLRNANLSEPDILGRAYEYLIERFADDAGKKGGEFYTPRKVVQLIVEILAPKEKMRICDPTCGSGGMLIECAKYLERHKGNAKNLSLYGQEKNLGTWAICKMNMLLHGLRDATIEKGDTIRDPKLRDRNGNLMMFDRVIANPPFSLDEWGYEAAESDSFGRFRLGLPPRNKGDFAFIQHMLATLNATGRLGVVMPHGVLFRGGTEAEIRAAIVREDLLDAVIGLPPNLFYGTPIPAAILVVDRARPAERRDRVLFIDASREFSPSTNQNQLSAEHVAKIADTYRRFTDVAGYARIVKRSEIEGNEFNLMIGRYVDWQTAEEVVDLRVATAALVIAQRERNESEAKVAQILAGLGYGK